MRIAPAVLGTLFLAPAVAAAQAAAAPEPPVFVRGYVKPPLVTLGVAPAVAQDPRALREAATAACEGVRPCAARVWVGQAQRFRTMTTAEVRSMVASYVIAADGGARFVCGPAGTAPATGSAPAASTGAAPQRPAG